MENEQKENNLEKYKDFLDNAKKMYPVIGDIMKQIEKLK